MVIVFTENKKSNNPNNKKEFKNALDIYVNGLLKTRKELSSVPIFNDSDLWMNLFGGYDGFIANMKYFPKAIELEEIHDILKTCPNEQQCGVKLDCPEYLNNNWWFNK